MRLLIHSIALIAAPILVAWYGMSVTTEFGIPREMTRDRIAVRRKAWEDGAWVREAARAHAAKRAARKASADVAAE